MTVEVKPMSLRTLITGTAAALLLTLVQVESVIAQNTASTDEQYNYNVGRKLSVGIAAGHQRFNTNFKFTERSSGRDVFVDAEGTLGLPETQTIPILYGFWRPSKRHGLGFSYFSVDRDTTLLAVDKDLGNLNVTGSVDLADKSQFYYLSYNLTAFQDDRAYVFASFGLYGLNLKYEFDARGDLTFRDVPITSGRYSETINQFAPLPMIGIDGWFALTPKWALGAKVSFIAGSYKDVTAAVLESKIRVKYAFNKNVGLFFGVNYFNGDIEIKKSDTKTDISYGFDGLFLGLDFGF
jgi:hypothetical protein